MSNKELFLIPPPPRATSPEAPSVPLATARTAPAKGNAGKRIWLRRDGEAAREYEGFRKYRDLPASRRQGSLAEIALASGCTYRTVRTWCARREWKRRAKAYDNHCDAEAIKIKLHDRRPMDRRHAELGRAMQETAARALKKLQGDLRAGARLEPRDIARMLATGIELERLVAGKPTQRIADERPDLSALGETELEFLSVIQTKIRVTK